MIENKHDLKGWLWVWLPLGLFVLIIGTALTNNDIYIIFFYGEYGAVELLTPLILVPAIISGFVIFINREKLVARQLGYWILLVTLACIYIAGEEISWGQQLVG